MDLREKFLRDLFKAMFEQDKGNPKYDDLEDAQKVKAFPIAEFMIKQGWYFDPEKGKR
jgi:hypothetical protein